LKTKEERYYWTKRMNGKNQTNSSTRISTQFGKYPKRMVHGMIFSLIISPYILEGQESWTR
jgi:hypothetical protein